MTIKIRPKSEHSNVFINRLGNPYNGNSLSKKISKLAKRIGLNNISPNSLRRAFASINSGRGKPLNHLRIALVHSDISTTQGYLMTSTDEVVLVWSSELLCAADAR